MQTLFAVLEKQGYTVKRGANVKHTAIKPPGGERFIRLGSLGEGYTEADLKARAPGAPKTTPVQVHIPQQKRCRAKRYSGNSRKAKPKACAAYTCIICICWLRPDHINGVRCPSMSGPR